MFDSENQELNNDFLVMENRMFPQLVFYILNYFLCHYKPLNHND